eukprot:6463663-Amphidinium_carterae.1
MRSHAISKVLSNSIAHPAHRLEVVTSHAFDPDDCSLDEHDRNRNFKAHYDVARYLVIMWKAHQTFNDPSSRGHVAHVDHHHGHHHHHHHHHHHQSRIATVRDMSQSYLKVHRKVFIDSDDLKRVDLLFEYVLYHTETLVVLCTSEILTRPWCVGEVTSAMSKKQADLKRSVEPQNGWEATFESVWGGKLAEVGWLDTAVRLHMLDRAWLLGARCPRSTCEVPRGLCSRVGTRAEC